MNPVSAWTSSEKSFEQWTADGELSEQSGEFREAISCYMSALATKPTSKSTLQKIQLLAKRLSSTELETHLNFHIEQASRHLFAAQLTAFITKDSPPDNREMKVLKKSNRYINDPSTDAVISAVIGNRLFSTDSKKHAAYFKEVFENGDPDLLVTIGDSFLGHAVIESYSPSTSASQTRKHLDAACKYYTKALERDPKHIDACCGMGDILSLQGEFDKAKGYFFDALSNVKMTLHSDASKDRASFLNTRLIRALVAFGFLERQGKHIDEAYSYFDEADKLSNGEFNYGALGIAEIHFHRKNFSKAEELFNALEVKSPNNPLTLLLRGVLRHFQNNFIKAYEDLNHPEMESFILGMVQREYFMELDKLFTFETTKMDVWYPLVIESDLSIPLFYIAFKYFTENSFEKASSILVMARKINPHLMEVHYLQAMVCLKTNDFAQIVSNEENVVSTVPFDAKRTQYPGLKLAYSHALGEAHFFRGEFDDSKAHYLGGVQVSMASKRMFPEAVLGLLRIVASTNDPVEVFLPIVREAFSVGISGGAGAHPKMVLTLQLVYLLQEHYQDFWNRLIMDRPFQQIFTRDLNKQLLESLKQNPNDGQTLGFLMIIGQIFNPDKIHGELRQHLLYFQKPTSKKKVERVKVNPLISEIVSSSESFLTQLRSCIKILESADFLEIFPADDKSVCSHLSTALKDHLEVSKTIHNKYLQLFSPLNPNGPSDVVVEAFCQLICKDSIFRTYFSTVKKINTLSGQFSACRERNNKALVKYFNQLLNPTNDPQRSLATFSPHMVALQRFCKYPLLLREFIGLFTQGSEATTSLLLTTRAVLDYLTDELNVTKKFAESRGLLEEPLFEVVKMANMQPIWDINDLGSSELKSGTEVVFNNNELYTKVPKDPLTVMCENMRKITFLDSEIIECSIDFVSALCQGEIHQYGLITSGFQAIADSLEVTTPRLTPRRIRSNSTLESSSEPIYKYRAMIGEFDPNQTFQILIAKAENIDKGKAKSAFQTFANIFKNAPEQ